MLLAFYISVASREKFLHIPRSDYNFTITTLYFVRSGYIELLQITGSLRYAGPGGRYWPRTATSKHWSGTIIASAFNFGFSVGDDVLPSGGPSNRWPAYSLRCLDINRL